jgi:hypothetical protein
MWLSHATLFDSVSDVQYLPSNVTLLDLFSPQWLSQHDESLQQTFELHRVK